MLEKLAQPFAGEDVSWRLRTVSRDKKRAQALPYAEPRVYEDRLNALCRGLRRVAFKPWGEKRVICELTIGAEDEFGQLNFGTRSSNGEKSEGLAPGTAAEAQAFKRACSRFGLGRYLYDVPIAWVAFDAEERRLLEAPTLPERFHPQPEPVASVYLDNKRVHAFHKAIGKLATIASSEHVKLVGEAVGRTVESFTELTEQEALVAWNHVRKVDAARRRGNEQGQGLAT